MTPTPRDNAMIAARLAELRKLAVETAVTFRQFERDLNEALPLRRLRAERNVPGKTRGPYLR